MGNIHVTIWKTNLEVLLRGFVGQRVRLQDQLRDEHRLDTARLGEERINMKRDYLTRIQTKLTVFTHSYMKKYIIRLLIHF